ncbi:unnamed protein product, partial [Ectocarpus sp. 12 AP-2014]
GACYSELSNLTRKAMAVCTTAGHGNDYPGASGVVDPFPCPRVSKDIRTRITQTREWWKLQILLKHASRCFFLSRHCASWRGRPPSKRKVTTQGTGVELLAPDTSR